jgi:hypothetical protein
MRAVGLFLIAICFIAGLVFYFSIGQYPQPISQELLDSQLSRQVDEMARNGQLSSAIKLLLEEMDRNGLTVEMSDKLDELYLKLARDYQSKGNFDKAVDALRNVPPDSSKYIDAQILLKELTGKSVSPQ